ncbi:MAG: hypothetical protein ACOCU4_04310, partial [Alkalispirochaeta sp.]
RWIADVTFYKNGGTEDGGGSSTQSVYVNDGDSTTVIPPNLTAAYDYDVFMGWYSDSALSTLVSSEIASVSVSGTGSIYAGWGPNPLYAVGEPGTGGGTVFYVKDGAGPRATSQTWRFLEVAPTDIDGVTEDGSLRENRARWGLHVRAEDQSFTTISTHNTLGGGKEATEAILSQKESSETNNAAYQVSQYGNAGDDWYLPSVAELLELSELWENVNIGMVTGTGLSHRYWASTSEGNNEAMNVWKSSSGASLQSGPYARNNHLRVRPVRRF